MSNQITKRSEKFIRLWNKHQGNLVLLSILCGGKGHKQLIRKASRLRSKGKELCESTIKDYETNIVYGKKVFVFSIKERK